MIYIILILSLFAAVKFVFLSRFAILIHFNGYYLL